MKLKNLLLACILVTPLFSQETPFAIHIERVKKSNTLEVQKPQEQEKLKIATLIITMAILELIYLSYHAEE